MRSSPRPEPEGHPGVLVYGSVEEIAEQVPADLADALARIRSAPASQAPALRGSELSGAGGAIATAVAVTTAMTVLDRPDVAGAGEAWRTTSPRSRHRSITTGAAAWTIARQLGTTIGSDDVRPGPQPKKH